MKKFNTFPIVGAVECKLSSLQFWIRCWYIWNCFLLKKCNDGSWILKNTNLVNLALSSVWVFHLFFNIWDRGLNIFVCGYLLTWNRNIGWNSGCLCSILGSLDLATNKFVQGWSSSSVWSVIFHIKSGKIKLMSSLFFKMSALD